MWASVARPRESTQLVGRLGPGRGPTPTPPRHSGRSRAGVNKPLPLPSPFLPMWPSLLLSKSSPTLCLSSPPCLPLLFSIPIFLSFIPASLSGVAVFTFERHWPATTLVSRPMIGRFERFEEHSLPIRAATSIRSNTCSVSCAAALTPRYVCVILQTCLRDVCRQAGSLVLHHQSLNRTAL